MKAASVTSWKKNGGRMNGDGGMKNECWEKQRSAGGVNNG